MAITSLDKIKIDRYLKANNINDIYYLDMCEAICKKSKISDLEFIEYFTSCVLDEFSKDEKISYKHLNKLIFTIDSFLQWIHESNQKIKEEILDKIRSFEDFYNEYLKRTGYEEDEQFKETYRETLLKSVNKFYPKEKSDESLTKYINKVSELEEIIKKLNKSLLDITKERDKLQNSYEKKETKIDTLSGENSTLKKDNKAKDKEITKLNKTIDNLTSKVNELQELLEKAQEKNICLEKIQEECELLKKEISKLNKIIQDNLKEKADLENIEIRESKIKNLIYQKLLVEKVTIDDVLEYLKENGFILSKEETYNLLKNIKKQINITTNSFSTSPTYRITVPLVLKNGQFNVNIPNGCKHYDIMLISDSHIEKINNKVLNEFEILNNYCAKEKINLILNLGDFFHGVGGNVLNYENAVGNYKLIESFINLMPKQEGLYHAVLGGNHELAINRYGFDPIKILSDEREDFINLGYNHSTILLNNASKELGRFNIHHPNSFDFPINLTENGLNMTKLDNYLNELYSKQGKNRDDSYIDIFGHVHKNQFNYLASCCYLAAYDKETPNGGATHLRIYFDEDNKIKYMIFMPLVISDKLIKTNEIVYQKILTK